MVDDEAIQNAINLVLSFLSSTYDTVHCHDGEEAFFSF